ncbi:MAG: ATP-binding protein [Candidatus Pacearchaeota archaeon]|nr:ATP-binding protein [Candidatus Pacearchaeota archaeon]
MGEKIIIKDMEETNIWWTKDLPTSDYKDRDIYQEIKKFMKTRQIVAITGLRRVGKTTMMLKFIKEYLTTGFSKQNIFYFSFDDYSSVRISDIIDVYKKLVNKDLRSEEYLFVFDEIQKIKNWEEQLKRIYDLYPKIKFLISGSESLFIRRKSRESLAGRIFEFKLNPLNFKEYLDFKDKKFDNLMLYKDEILKEFNNFLMCNGFPELIDKEPEIIKKYIREGVIDKILYHDMSEVFEVKNLIIIRKIFDIIYNDPGQIIELQRFAGEVGITRHLLSEYLEYLEESFLIKKLYNYSRNARKTQRRLKKYYSTLLNPLLIKDDFAKVFEQAIVIHSNADFFWRDAYKNEVDIIKTEPLTAIEVKSGEIKEGNLISLKKFIEKFKPKKAIVLSYETEREIESIKVIPAWKWLLS